MYSALFLNFGIIPLLRQVEKLERQNRRILKRLKAMSAQLDVLTAKVTEIETVGSSVIALLAGLKTQLDEAIASADPPAALQALSDRLSAEAQALSDAVLANTPAEVELGEPPVEPEPIPGT